PNQLARLIAEAVEHPGFSFVHVLSQCITFCPEQTDWKAVVSEREAPALTDADAAASLFLHENGFQTGVLYNAARNAWPPEQVERQSTDITEGFRL
ncbi:MAG: 2-oxoacid:ferredoxin oxidoreductase subunit beta, partial [Halieaceae bacterium]|nr:2-oxoacid:ferredoxin oxidoreductase subunit beta [Halieaceae bacterium]